jgi:hypothetical protein
MAPDTTIHSFIIKVWVEDSLDSPGERRWHGYVTHVPSGTRVYIPRLEDIVNFIQRLVGEEIFGDQPPQSKQDPLE